MAFIKVNSNILSFANYSDVYEADQRLFDANEGLTDEVIEAHLIRSTERILTLLRATSWWVNITKSESISASPQVVAAQIRSRQNDFTDLCVYYALFSYILPNIADFGSEDNSEYAKISFYQNKFQILFDELITSGDWYDVNNDGSVTSSEMVAGKIALKRIR